MEPSNGTDHFNKTFWLLAGALAMAFLYIFLITFINIPEKNIRFADTAQGFMLGTVVAGVIGYFAGGTAPVKKTETTTTPGTTGISLQATTTNEKKD